MFLKVLLEFSHKFRFWLENCFKKAESLKTHREVRRKSKFRVSQIHLREKTARFSSKTEVFFERSTLTAGGGRSSGSSETYCTSF